MRKSRFTEEQIIGLLKQAEAGRPVAELCRQIGITDTTLYKWRSKFAGLEVSEARPFRQPGPGPFPLQPPASTRAAPCASGLVHRPRRCYTLKR
ncbi:MAG: transposase [Desulfovibrio sp.]|jgi:putative transposase|nr:transposase [Desulfovibrio sp.]